jgi:hypothetical protein
MFNLKFLEYENLRDLRPPKMHSEHWIREKKHLSGKTKIPFLARKVPFN